MKTLIVLLCALIKVEYSLGDSISLFGVLMHNGNNIFGSAYLYTSNKALTSYNVIDKYQEFEKNGKFPYNVSIRFGFTPNLEEQTYGIVTYKYCLIKGLIILTLNEDVQNSLGKNLPIYSSFIAEMVSGALGFNVLKWPYINEDQRRLTFDCHLQGTDENRVLFIYAPEVTFEGLLGCPVFQNNKLVGITSNYYKNSGRLYFIPVIDLKGYYPNFEAPIVKEAENSLGDPINNESGSSSGVQSEETSTTNRRHKANRSGIPFIKCLSFSKTQE